jgi:predicted transposase/invertase (TIGR01784 family)
MLKKQGYEKGVQSGKQEGKLEIAKKLLSSGSDVKTVSEITDLSISEIKSLID